MVNELLLSGGLYQPTVTGSYQVSSSALSIVSNIFPFIFWRCRLGRWSHALDEVIYPVIEEHREQNKRRADHMKREDLGREEMVELHKNSWVANAASNAAKARFQTSETQNAPGLHRQESEYKHSESWLINYLSSPKKPPAGTDLFSA